MNTWTDYSERSTLTKYAGELELMAAAYTCRCSIVVIRPGEPSLIFGKNPEMSVWALYDKVKKHYTPLFPTALGDMQAKVARSEHCSAVPELQRYSLQKLDAKHKQMSLRGGGKSILSDSGNSKATYRSLQQGPEANDSMQCGKLTMGMLNQLEADIGPAPRKDNSSRSECIKLTRGSWPFSCPRMAVATECGSDLLCGSDGPSVLQMPHKKWSNKLRKCSSSAATSSFGSEQVCRKPRKCSSSAVAMDDGQNQRVKKSRKSFSSAVVDDDANQRVRKSQKCSSSAVVNDGASAHGLLSSVGNSGTAVTMQSGHSVGASTRRRLSTKTAADSALFHLDVAAGIMDHDDDHQVLKMALGKARQFQLGDSCNSVKDAAPDRHAESRRD